MGFGSISHGFGLNVSLNAKISPALKDGVQNWEHLNEFSFEDFIHLPSVVFEDKKTGLLKAVDTAI
jgi:hypothetical protein